MIQILERDYRDPKHDKFAVLGVQELECHVRTFDYEVAEKLMYENAQCLECQYRIV